MKQKKSTELRSKKIETLRSEAQGLRDQLVKLHVKSFSGEQKNLKERMGIRHELSRILGIITELSKKETK